MSYLWLKILDSRKNEAKFTQIDGVPEWLMAQYNEKNFGWRKFCWFFESYEIGRVRLIFTAPTLQYIPIESF